MNIVTGSVATAMKMAELLSMGGPFLHQETNQSHTLNSEGVAANSTALARYRRSILFLG